MIPTVDSEDISQVTSLKEKHNLTSDVRDSSENSQVAIQSNNRDITVNMLIKELVFCIALALTTYGALHNTPSKVSKHPQAVRFFDSESVVTDWYRGQLANALAAVNLADVSFIMYYAPWDAESQHVRSEFEKAANVLNDRVHFSAINCWNPGSECRLQHNKIPSWPILMAYTVNSRGVLYKGPRDAHHMVHFLGLVMKPLERVSSTEDLVNLLSIYDAVAVAYTPLTDTSKYYNVWYNVALKSHEFDTVGEICFAVVTSAELAVDLGVESLPNAQLMLWNDTKEFKTENENRSWNESTLMQWVLENFSQPVARIIPMWKKSFSFERYADGSPMLLLFTPLNPMYEQLPSYSLLREVAMEYYNCKNNDTNQWIAELIKLQQVQRLIYQQKNFYKFCQEYKVKKPIRKQKKNFYDNYEQCHLFEDNDSKITKMDTDKENVGTTMLPREDDPLSAEGLIQGNVEHLCRLSRFAAELGPPISPAKVTGGNITHIDGLSCTGNTSLHMIAVDSVQNHHFPEALGIDIAREKDMTAVVILDSRHGSQYVLAEEYSAKSIRDFIYNYTRNELRRSLRTQVADAVHTHYYGLNDVIGGDDVIGVADLTSRTFRRFVTAPGTVSLVAVCGGSCGAHASRALLGAARLLSRCGVPARAARLDAARHDLPAHLDAHLYPALLVFVADGSGEADSRVYPLSERVSSGGLVALALRSLGVPHHLRARVALCSATSNIEKKACLRDIREHISNLIGTNLKYWRRTDVRELKDSLLRRLQHLNQISLHLSLLHSTDLKENNLKQKSLLDAVGALANAWRIDVSVLRKNSTTTNRTR
ncbi:unnamed protein product, partial [Iphiclides podalirius]